MSITDPEFWSFLVAFFALILSQLPPIIGWFKGTKIIVNIPEIVSLSYFLGNVQIYALINIQNKGGQEVTVGNIEWLLKEKNNQNNHFILRLPARTYLLHQYSSASQQIPELLISTISLKPGEHWSETVRF